MGVGVGQVWTGQDQLGDSRQSRSDEGVERSVGYVLRIEAKGLADGLDVMREKEQL